MANDLTKAGITQIHIVPFDLGYIFYDILSISNEKNIKFATRFVTELQDAYKDSDIKVYNNLKPHFTNNKLVSVSYLKKEIADQSVCFVELKDNLYCYILTNGIGVFVFADFNSNALSNYKQYLEGYNKTITAYIQKRLTQSSILNKLENNYSIFPDEEKLMLDLRIKCWDIINSIAKKMNIKKARPFSSNISYKSQGLSYVLTIYIIKNNELSNKEINYLMYSPLPKGIHGKQYWDLLQNDLLNFNDLWPETIVNTNHSIMHFSWSAVSAIVSNDINNFDEVVENTEISNLVKAEIYVQSRWFIADNSMDNITKNYNCKLEELQRMESLAEFYQAELDNEISANMDTLFKQILEKVVLTSSVKNLYKSVLNQMKTQRKIKEAHDADRRKRNGLILNLFMAIFTASSLFKTVSDLISKDFSITNIFIFVAMLIVAIFTVLFDYYNK